MSKNKNTVKYALFFKSHGKFGRSAAVVLNKREVMQLSGISKNAPFKAHLNSAASFVASERKQQVKVVEQTT